MKKQKFLAVAIATIATLFSVSACKEKETPAEEVKTPTITIKSTGANESSISFSIAIENAEKAAYIILDPDTKEPEYKKILETGTAIDLKNNTPYTIDNLTPTTAYTVVVAAENKTKNKVERLIINTTKPPFDQTYHAKDCFAIYYGNRYVQKNKDLYNYYFILSDVGFDESDFPKPNGEFFFRIDFYNVKAEDYKNAFIPEGEYKLNPTEVEPGFGMMGSKSGFFRTDATTLHQDKHNFKEATLKVSKTANGWHYEVTAILDNDQIYYVDYEGPVTFDNQSSDGAVDQQMPPLEADFNATFNYGEGNVQYQEGTKSQVDMTFTDMKIENGGLVPPGNVLYVTLITELKNGKLQEMTYLSEDKSKENFFVKGMEVDNNGFAKPSFTCVQIVNSTSDKKTGYCIDGNVKVAKSEKGFRFDFEFRTLDGHKVTAVYDGPFAIYGPGESILTEDFTVKFPEVGATAEFYGDTANKGNGLWEMKIIPPYWPDGGTGDGLVFQFYTKGLEFIKSLETYTYKVGTAGTEGTFVKGTVETENNKIVYAGTHYLKYESYQAVGSAPIVDGTISITNVGSGKYTLTLDCIDDSGHKITGTWTNSIIFKDKRPAPSAN